MPNTIEEIERRFLVRSIDPDIQRFPNKEIVQGYFETPPQFSLRVRITRKRDQSARAEITRKDGCGAVRQEHNQPVTVEAAEFLLNSCSDVIRKTRFVRDGWEIDFFHDALTGLVLAEYEMPSADFDLRLPDWIQDATEVTQSLTNRHLARLARDIADSGSDRPVRELLPNRRPRIVLTGGPCSGKSALMAELQARFGGALHCVPEVATIVIAQVGVKPPMNDPVGARQFQRTIYRVQRGFETISDLQAASDDKKALLLDRGTIDGAAYIRGGLKELEYACRTTREHEFSLYDLVICLETPPREIFEKMSANNPARSETYGTAVRLGRRIARIWGQHPRFTFIRNDDSWEAKSRAAISAVASFLSSL
ncbi:MAG: AAA family ATPase [Patescibacteria group bacterium]|jgi:CYTH domain-containing protein/predicted ATPase